MVFQKDSGPAFPEGIICKAHTAVDGVILGGPQKMFRR